MKYPDCIESIRHIFPFWPHLTEPQAGELCRHIAPARFARGQNVHGASGHCTGAIVVKSGLLRVYMLSEAGREITLYRLYPGDICMLSASCVLSAITFDVLVDAEADTEVYLVNPGFFAQLCQENVYVENFALRIAAERFSDVMWAMQQILFMSLDKRLALFLSDELTRTGGDTLRMTQEQIARYMGSAREVVSRMLKYFASEGLVEVVRGGIRVLDKERLRQIAL
jgi:CRP/FNR family transcriptional regulator